MFLLLTRATAFLELVQTTSEQYSDVIRTQAHSRVHSDASVGQSLGSAFLPWEMFSPFLFFSMPAI